jgi:integrase
MFTPQTPAREFFIVGYLPSRNLRPASRLQYEIQIGTLERFSRESGRGLLRLESFTNELIYAAMQWQLDAGLEATTANKLRRHANALWNEACEQGILKTRPRNKKYRENLSAPIALMPDELEKLLAAAGERVGMVGDVPAGQWWLTAVLFVYSLGARIGAAYQVPTRNLDLVRGEVLVTADTQKQREDQSLDLFVGVVYWLRELRLAERGIATVLGDWPYKIDALRRHYTDLFVESGLYPRREDVPRNLKFHALRKTLASQLFVEGGMAAACERLGHSSTLVTQRYIDPRYKRKQRIGDLVKDPSPARLPNPTLKIHRDAAG